MRFKQIPGIYKIVNKINNKIYIGSSINVSVRITAHKNCLKRGNHANNYLQNSYNKYGENNFEFTLIEYCLEHDLLNKEGYYINLYNSSNSIFGYNIGSFETGRKRLSEETKKKIGDAHKGKPKNYPKTEKQIEIARLLGKKAKSDKTRKKMSVARTGIKRLPFSDEWIENMTKSRTKLFFDLYQNGELKYSKQSISNIMILLNVSRQSVCSSYQNNHKVKGYILFKTS